MKRFFLVVLLTVCLVFMLPLCGACTEGSVTETSNTDYLRIHIRANSNSAEDQSVKYAVRDAVVAYLTPMVEGCSSKGEAWSRVSMQLDQTVSVAEKVLKEEGFSYGAKAELRRETFPTRVYGDLELASGEYDALIVELGSGTGDNWWCVVYPPLCFSGDSDVTYRSILVEWWQKIFS